MRLTLLTHDDRRLEATVKGYVCASNEDTWLVVIDMDGPTPEKFEKLRPSTVVGWEIVVSTAQTTLSGTITSADSGEIIFKTDET